MGNAAVKNTPEIVAPAGSAEGLKMALKFGADAVYLGLDRFNARMKADNFDIAGLNKWADYIHSRGAKLYLTFNTLVKQSELDSAARLAAEALTRGADALILQDLGLLKAVRAIDGGAVIHASTQMGVHNLEGAEYVKGLGVSRVILSRETPLADIARIKEKTGLEVEVFVQGALCVSFSGNCYFSSYVSGHSGNRGMCMQLCRKQYRAMLDGKEAAGGYLLSPGDICLYKEVGKLIDAGVDSLKIEGRMRRPEYVGEAVRVYKRAVSGICEEADTDALKSVYNRGDYNTGYLYDGGGSALIYPKIQGHMGLLIGEVIKAGGGLVTVRTARGVYKDDAFKILRDGRESGSAVAVFTQGAGECRLRAYGNVKPGDMVHITTDTKQIERLNN